MNEKDFIHINNAVKTFNKKIVLNNASIKFDMGYITAIVSPNGSGKTTSINIISGFINLEQGEIIFSNGITSKDVSVVFGGEKNLYMKNTVKENIYYLAMIKGLDKKQVFENINRFKHLIPEYDEIENLACEQLSHGQKRLVSILIAIVSNSKIIILDEPTEGLDQKHINILKKIISTIKNDKIIIICSQDYSFVDSITDRIYFLNEHKFSLSSREMSLEDEYTIIFGR